MRKDQEGGGRREKDGRMEGINTYIYIYTYGRIGKDMEGYGRIRKNREG